MRWLATIAVIVLLGAPALAQFDPPSADNIPREQPIKLLDQDGIVRLQNELIRAQCFAGPANGVWGRTSHEALMAFNIHSGVEMASVEPDIESLKLAGETLGIVCPESILRNATPFFEDGFP